MVWTQYLLTYATVSSPRRNRQCEQCVVADVTAAALFELAKRRLQRGREWMEWEGEGEMSLFVTRRPFATLVPSVRPSVRADSTVGTGYKVTAFKVKSL